MVNIQGEAPDGAGIYIADRFTGICSGENSLVCRHSCATVAYCLLQFETLNGMKELQNAVLEGYTAGIFRPYAPGSSTPPSLSQSTADECCVEDVKSFLEAKQVPNSVTVCVSKISHPGKSSNQHEVDLLKSLVPESEWKNIKITLISPSCQ